MGDIRHIATQRLAQTAAAHGLTALELLVSVTIVSLLASLGIPALRDLALNSQRVAAANSLVAAVQLARSAAATRNATTTLCPSADARSCLTGTTAGNRWIVTVTEPGPAGPTAAFAGPLRVIDLTFSGTIISNRTAFEIRPFPLRSTNGTIRLCDPRGGAAERAIVISTSGRPRIARPSAQTGFPACANR
jgi:type IV fimbrial biogenesis protein FimT